MSIIEKAIEKARRDKKVKISQSLSDLAENNKIPNVAPLPLGVASNSESVHQRNNEKLPLVESFNIKHKTHKSKNISINHLNESRNRFLYSDNEIALMFEEFRIIKRPLIKNAFSIHKDDLQRANLILITSSKPGEGKTFTAINLALSIASEMDKKVLLVDADVAKPSISKELGINTDLPGLIDYLEGDDLDLAEMMMKTNISGLSIIPAGKKHAYSTELLASNRMILLAEELHSRYSDRIVIFDSPPLLVASQSEVLASLVGQVVLVVEAETTLQTMVLESLNKLKECDVVLTLLNKSKNNFCLGSYGYAYGQYGN